MNKQRWTKEEIFILKDMISKKETNQNIAKILNRTISSVSSKRYTLHNPTVYRSKITLQSYLNLAKKHDLEFIGPIPKTSIEKTNWRCKVCNIIFILSYNTLSVKKNKYKHRHPISYTHPDIASELIDENYNKDIVTYGNNNIVLWLCKNNHKWAGKICDRTMFNKSCPFCDTKRIIVGQNDLFTLYPLLSIEWDYSKNIINPLTLYKSSNKKIHWICNKCKNSWIASIATRTDGSDCPFCSKPIRKILIGFNDLTTSHPHLILEWNDDKNPQNYTYGSICKIQWKCSKCNDIWISSIANRVKGRGCPKCNESYGEKRIAEILDKYNIKYKKEQTFPKCKYINLLKFDFYLIDYNILLEYQGLQHYPEKYKKIHTNGIYLKKLEINKKRDNIKKEFCKMNNIHLVEIPYWKYNNIEQIIKDIIC